MVWLTPTAVTLTLTLTVTSTSVSYDHFTFRCLGTDTGQIRFPSYFRAVPTTSEGQSKPTLVQWNPTRGKKFELKNVLVWQGRIPLFDREISDVACRSRRTRQAPTSLQVDRTVLVLVQYTRTLDVMVLCHRMHFWK